MKVIQMATFAAGLWLCVFTAAAQTPQAPSIQINEANRTISVSADEHAEADADTADLHIGYTVYGATLPETYKTASDTSNTIVKAITSAGAKRSDIQSQTQNVSRLNDYEMKQQKGAKFRVTQSWTVSLAPNEAAAVLDAAIQAGANQSGDIEWKLKNNSALDAEAIRRATARTHVLAEELAKGLGATLGKALYATNNVNNSVVAPRVMSFAMRKAEPEGAAPLAVEPQRVRSEANVLVVYALQ